MRTRAMRRYLGLSKDQPMRIDWNTWERADARELVDFAARMRLPDGTQRVWTQSDLLDAPQMAGFVLYSDTRQRRLTIHVPAGAVLELEEEVVLHDVRLSAANHMVEGSLPILKKTVRVRAPRAWTLVPSAWHLGEPLELAPTTTMHDGQQQLSWRFENLHPVVARNYDPSTRHLRRRVAVQLVDWTDGAGWRSAGEMGAALAGLYAAKSTLKPAQKAWLDDLVAGQTTPRARARRIAEWVQESIRYCAIAIGMGGYIPHPAQAVLETGYGDCKDQATLTVELLRQVGIAATVLLVRAGVDLRAPFEVPVLGHNYNHAIVRLDLDPPVYFDPTRRWVPFGEVGRGIAGAEVLPLTAGAQLERIPEHSPKTNALKAIFNLKFNGLDWEGHVDMGASGSFAHWLRGRIGESAALRLQALKTCLPDTSALLAVEAFEDPRSAHVPMTARGVVRLEQPGVGAPLVVRPGSMGEIVRSIGPKGGRLVRMRAPRRVTYVFRFEWPHPVELPPPIRIDSVAGHYIQRWRRDGHVVELHRQVDISKRIAPRAAMHAWTQAIETAEARQLVLEAP
jgi:transglutaminase-like putative cysteine protease